MGPWVLPGMPLTRDSTSFWAAVCVKPEALASELARGSRPHVLPYLGVGAKGEGFEVGATLPVLSMPLGAVSGGFGPGGGGAGFGFTSGALGLESCVGGFFSAAVGSSPTLGAGPS
jgi:hypothetical protein